MNIEKNVYSKDVHVNYLFCDYPFLHTHEYYEFFIVLDGEYEHTINKKKVQIKRGISYLIRPNDCHLLKQVSSSASHINIIVEPKLIDEAISQYGEGVSTMLNSYKYIEIRLGEIELKTLEQNCIRYQNESNTESKSLFDHFIVNWYINKVIEQLLIIKNAFPEWLMNLIAQLYKKENMSWTVQDLVKNCSISHTHLIREFKKYIGCSVIEFLTKIKLSFASDYLKNTALNVSEISYLLGYTSVSHLNHIFKEHTGMTPLEYRNKSKQESSND